MGENIDFKKANDLQLFTILHFDDCSSADKEKAFQTLKARGSVFVTQREIA
jgi:hypothetical protein